MTFGSKYNYFHTGNCIENVIVVITDVTEFNITLHLNTCLDYEYDHPATIDWMVFQSS